MSPESENIGKILNKGKYTSGNVIQNNIEEGKQIAGYISPTLGPDGTYKLIINDKAEENQDTEHFEVSNNGAYLLSRVSFNSPVGRLIARAAISQKDEYGDGTKTAVLYAGNLLNEVESLIGKGIHPNTVINGISITVDIVKNALDERSTPLSPSDSKMLTSLVDTNLKGRAAGPIKDVFNEQIVAHIKNKSQTEKTKIDLDNIQILRLRSGTIRRSKCVNGLICKKSFANYNPPKEFESGKLAIFTQDIARKESIAHRIGSDTDEGPKYSLSSPVNSKELINGEIGLLTDIIAPIVNSDVSVIVVGNRVEDDILHVLNENNIGVIRETQDEYLKKLSDLSGASIVSYIQDFSREDIGSVDRIDYHHSRPSNQDLIYFLKEQQTDVMSILIRGSAWVKTWEIERNINNTLRSAKAALDDKRLVPGGGAIEVSLARGLRRNAVKYDGLESLVIEAAADAFETFPATLARNCGMDKIDTITTLLHEHEKGNTEDGILASERAVGNTFDHGVVDPTLIKQNAFETAASVVSAVLRIDDIITGINPRV